MHSIAAKRPPLQVPLEESRWLMIWRNQWLPHFRTIGTVEHSALSKLQGGNAVAAVCVEVDTLFGEENAASAVATLLRGWIDEALICELTGLSGSPSAGAAPAPCR